MSDKLRYKVEKVTAGAFTDAAYLDSGEDPGTAVVRDALDTLKINVLITVGDYTMHAAAWEQPEHWADEWVKALGVTPDEVAGHVTALLASAIERQPA